MSDAEKDMFLSPLMIFGCIGVFILLCIKLLEAIEQKQEGSQRGHHGSGLNQQLLHSLSNMNNTMLQMEMEHKRSMSRLLDRIFILEEELNLEDQGRRQRDGNGPPRLPREDREATSRSASVSLDNIPLAGPKEEKNHAMSEEVKKLMAVIRNLCAQNKELMKSLEEKNQQINLIEELVASNYNEIQALKESVFTMGRFACRQRKSADEICMELPKPFDSN